MGPVLFQSKGLFALSNLKISKEITITPINNVENSMMYNLKKLPDITFHVVKHEPTLNPKKFYGSDDKSKSVLDRKVLSEIQENRIVKNSSFQKSSLLKPNKKPIKDITILKKNNHDTIISKNPKKIVKKYSYPEVKNIKTQKTSCINKLPKQSLQFTNLHLKTLNNIEPAKKTSQTSTISHEEKKISDKSSTVNNIENKAHETANEVYLPSDLSLEGPIVTAPHRFDFINMSLNLPNYDSSYVYNDILTSSLIQDNHSIDTWTVQNDSQLLQEMRSYFCDNLSDNNTEFETKSMEFIEDSPKVFLENVQGSSFTHLVEDKIGIKRWQPQNEFHKKVKPDNESILHL